jgi:small subunit ribosomal protein S15
MNRQEQLETIRQHPTDTGSVEVQVTMLTSEISYLTEHLKQNPKDKSSKRGLLAKVNRRTSFLKYLKEHKLEVYNSLIKMLGIRK